VATVAKLVIIGVVAGISSGFFGIGGGIVIVPALIYWVGYNQHRAVGTSLAVLLPPVGLAATLEYYRKGNVDIRAAMIIAVSMLLGGYVGAFGANKLSGPHLRLLFGLFVLGLGVYLIYGAAKRLGWI
jgi:uncharacterized membrane protein YfcA